MPFKGPKRRSAADRPIEKRAGDVLLAAVEGAGVKRARELVPYDTRALLFTIHAAGPVVKNGGVEVGLAAGGRSPLNGTQVDYALDMEIYKPYLVPSIAAIAEALSNAV